MKNKQQQLKNCLQENQYIIPSYQAYGGLSGFQDYGVLGFKVKSKLLDNWRNFFLNEYNDTIVEIETPVIVPYNLLKASGHVDRFTDFVVFYKDEMYRADHLAKNWFKEQGKPEMVDQVDTWNQEALEANINKYKMLPEEVKVQRKNLMFDITTPKQSNVDFLRPEIAQNMFVNFKSVQQFLQKPPPFGIAQIGSSFRKEISPTQFTRMRQFTQAEIEYFADPQNKNHVNFDKYKNTVIPILTSEMQMTNAPILKISVEEAVNKKLISHQIMAYFLAKVFLFATDMGMKPDKVRFRQHLPHEMAHYASECWDLEALVNDDWLECVGCADRGCYDLQTHSTHSNTSFKVRRYLDQPYEKRSLKPQLNMKIIGNQYKKLVPQILNHFNNLDQTKMALYKGELTHGNISLNLDSAVILTNEMLNIVEETCIIEYEEYYPHTIEPSFGIDRILYAIFEQNFWARENDEQRVVLSLPLKLSPYDIAVIALSKNDKLNPVVDQIVNTLYKDHHLKCYRDDSGVSIGRKYARIDEMGIKYVITVDFDTLNDHQVTIRERDSLKQIRVNIDHITESIIQLSK
ncbi:glycyl-tRNA synthetase [Klosneuvirus KNV1]|uniref:glycine--tRNA ligase n=1 Tax=Klosneuvirus KNV1 TaxID=1977640 RepID=A0A1V0SIF1_9VIRU|nr:glycyl-tRNA synthetase [Klosneuvirus KNV1]